MLFRIGIHSMFLIHYVCKSNESKSLKFLLSGPLWESGFDVRLIYAKTRKRSFYSSTNPNSILARERCFSSLH